MNELNDIKLFNEFKNYIVSGINQNKDFSDSSNFNYAIENFFFINLKKDSAKGEVNIANIPSEKMDLLKKTLNEFYNYFIDHKNEKLAENLKAIPIRIQ